MAGAQITTSVTILSSLLGYQGLSFTNWDTKEESQVAAGSKIEVAGAFFTFASNTSVADWDDNDAGYIGVVPSGTAGSQVLTPTRIGPASTPVWSTSKQGWYSSAGSVTRVIASYEKVWDGVWENKQFLRLNQALYEMDQDVKTTDIVTFDGITTTDKATIDGVIYSGTTQEGSQVVVSAGTVVIPKGIYQFGGLIDDDYRIQLYINSSWKTIAEGPDGNAGSQNMGATVISDGTNMRMDNGKPSTQITFRWLKLV